MTLLSQSVIRYTKVQEYSVIDAIVSMGMRGDWEVDL